MYTVLERLLMVKVRTMELALDGRTKLNKTCPQHLDPGLDVWNTQLQATCKMQRMSMIL